MISIDQNLMNALDPNALNPVTLYFVTLDARIHPVFADFNPSSEDINALISRTVDTLSDRYDPVVETIALLTIITGHQTHLHIAPEAIRALLETQF